MTLRDLLRNIVINNGGFLTSFSEEAELANHDRLRQVLVRCGNGRFVCAIQDVGHFRGIINRDGQDYVRDVSLLASDRAILGDYSATTQEVSTSEKQCQTIGKAVPIYTGHESPFLSHRGNSCDLEPSDADSGL